MLILASGSPRRHELLLAAGIEHVVRPTAVPEIPGVGETPTGYVQRLAREKAQAAVCGDGDIVLGADTVVCLDDVVFGKPHDPVDAANMLRRLSGRQHWVHTGICLLSRKNFMVDVASTTVTFAELSPDEISEYTRSGEPADKAGGYAIQGIASKFVTSIDGSYGNVVGLPVSLVYHHLKAFAT